MVRIYQRFEMILKVGFFKSLWASQIIVQHNKYAMTTMTKTKIATIILSDSSACHSTKILAFSRLAEWVMLMYQPGLLMLSSAFHFGDVAFATAAVASWKTKCLNFSALGELLMLSNERVQPYCCCLNAGHCLPAKFSSVLMAHC